jgi:transcriptional regulator with PAS, ATPase and Fis domain
MLESEILSAKQRFGIIGNSNSLNNAIRVAIQVAPTEMSALVNGESGSGKESFSKIIHQLSARKHNPFIAINCGAIPEGTIDSELFGHEKGAFTGASEARKGYFEATNGGTIFLDEIGELPLGTQARLLRVLENGEYIRVGSSKIQKTDVRVIAATNVNLLEAVQKNKFREDLYYRLNTVPIFVPPLRERGDDIHLLFRKFAADFSEKYRTKPIQLTPDAVPILLKYRFPGNIRQLLNIANQISTLEIDRAIDAPTLLKYLPDTFKSSLPTLFNESANDSLSDRELLYKVLFDMKRDVSELKKLVFESLQHESYGSEVINEHKELFKNIDEPALKAIEAPLSPETPVLVSPELEISSEPMVGRNIEDVTHIYEEETLSIQDKEKELILRALKKNNNRRKMAANDLGISERTLYRKIKQYGING